MYIVTNVKLSLKIRFICLDTVKQILSDLNICIKSYPNFLVFKKIYTFVLFKSKDNIQNHLNVTNIKRHENIEDVILTFKTLLNLEESDILSTTIDNITASFSIQSSFKFFDVLKNFKTLSKVTYNNEKFPGIFLKFKLGTVIVFHTGKCIVIGCKNLSDIECLVKEIHANI